MSRGYVRQRFEASEIGHELVIPTASTKLLYAPWQNFKASYGAEFLRRDDEARNADEPVRQDADTFAPSWSGTKRMYPDSLGFDLRHLLGNPTTTAGNGVIVDPSGGVIPTGVTRHVWTAPYGPTGLNPLTAMADIAYDDEGVYFAMRGMGMDELKITNQEKGGVQVATKGPATYLQRVANPTLTPVFETLATLPFRGGDLSLPTWLAGGSRVSSDFSVTIANPIKTQRTLNVRSYFPDTVEKDDDLISLMVEFDARSLDVQDIDAFVAQTPFTALMRWQSSVNVPTTSYPYQVWIAATLQLDSYELDELDNKRRHGAKVTARATRDSSASSTITVCNASTSYS